MKIPRDVTGPELVSALRRLGYAVTRQTGSHIRVTTQRSGEHHETVPTHHPLKVGTLHGILKTVAAHHGLSVEQLLTELDL
ncbi:MAG: type II toxin-antitoxin system HicA family toxin [Verrucomicrobia bacterium]|nr:type II toxin-antitoxin system HicA family toxin [Verrucomicrobiota bacterium]